MTMRHDPRRDLRTGGTTRTPVRKARIACTQIYIRLPLQNVDVASTVIYPGPERTKVCLQNSVQIALQSGRRREKTARGREIGSRATLDG